MVTKIKPDSRRWWRKTAMNRLRIIERRSARLRELEADYDLVETELKNLLDTCTCQPKEKP